MPNIHTMDLKWECEKCGKTIYYMPITMENVNTKQILKVCVECARELQNS